MPSPSSLFRLTECEARYDGPFPEHDRRALRHGTSLAADLAETRGEMAFFREMLICARRSGKAWRARGNVTMAARALTDCRIYLAGWRSRRRRLTALERERRVADAQRRTLAAIDSAVLGPLLGPRR